MFASGQNFRGRRAMSERPIFFAEDVRTPDLFCGRSVRCVRVYRCLRRFRGVRLYRCTRRFRAVRLRRHLGGSQCVGLCRRLRRVCNLRRNRCLRTDQSFGPDREFRCPGCADICAGLLPGRDPHPADPRQRTGPKPSRKACAGSRAGR